MNITAPKDVLAAVRQDFKERRITQDNAAEKTHYRSRQSIAAILSSDRYMTDEQANRFAEAFGYNRDFLSKGIGSLKVETPKEHEGEPLKDLMLNLADSTGENEFKEKVNSLLQFLVETYGRETAYRLIMQFWRYAALCIHPENDRTVLAQVNSLFPYGVRNFEERILRRQKALMIVQTDEMKESIENSKRRVLDRMYEDLCWGLTL